MSLPPLEGESIQSDSSLIIRAATIVGAAFVVSRFLGVARDAVINYYFDITSLEANAYFIASRFPEVIFYIIAGGALGSAFIPIFSAFFVREDTHGGWRLFSAVTNLITVVITVVAAIATILAPQIIRYFYADLVALDPELLDMTVTLMRIMLLTPIIFGISGVIMAALNARQHFVLPAIAPIIYNLGIIAGAILFAPNVIGLAIGTVGGALGHLAIQVPGLVRQRARYTPAFTVRDPGVLQVLRLMAPRVLGLSFGQLNHLLIQFLAQSMVLGSIPALTFAWRIMIMPQGVIGQALAIAAFPTFSTLAARGSFSQMRQILAGTLRLIAFLSLPAAVLLIVMRRPIVTVLFQRGQFGAEATDFVTWALLFFAISLVGLAAIEILSRAFYALEDTWTPVVVGAVQLLSMWLLGLWLGQQVFPRLGWLDFGGLALGYSISTLVEVICLLWLLRRKLGGIGGRQLADGLWRILIASLVMTAATWISLRGFRSAGVLWQLVSGSLVGGLVYIVASLVLGIKELQQLFRQVSRRFQRGPAR